MKTVVGGHGHHTTQNGTNFAISINYGHNIDVNPNYLSYEHNTIH